MGTAKHPRKNKLHGRARNYSGMSISVTGQSFCCSRVSIDGYCQALCLWFPTAFSQQGWEVTALQLVPLMPGCAMHLGTTTRLGQFLEFLSSLQMTHGNNMAATIPNYSLRLCMDILDKAWPAPAVCNKEVALGCKQDKAEEIWLLWSWNKQVSSWP